MAGSQSSFSWRPGTLVTNMRTFAPRLERAIVAATEYHGTRGEAYMRKNARWQDRTTNARNKLNTAVTHEGGAGSSRHTIAFAHGVPYGFWLEVRWSGRYAIIMRSVNHEGAALMNTLNKLISRLPS